MPQDHPLLQPLTVGGIQLDNRVAVAPMSRVSTAGDGVPTEAMARYYAEFARGGFGLIVSEGTYTDNLHAQAYPDQPAIVTSQQVEGWKRVTDAVHAAGGRIVAQLMHAGALIQGNHHTGEQGIAPSDVAPKGRKLLGYGGEGTYATPREATDLDISNVLKGIGDSARNAHSAGFDGIEIHAANGYLFDQFITTYTNQRSDRYGGSAANRARFAAEAIQAARRETSESFPVGVRVSQAKVNDIEYRWQGVEEAQEIFATLREAGPAYVHVASEGAGWEDTSFLEEGVSITAVAKEVVGVPVIANGGMHDTELSTRLLGEGHFDAVALGHGALANPDWPRRLSADEPFAEFDGSMLSPEVTIENTERWRREQAGEGALAGAAG
ncbi:MAG TPA: NADH:flavin oxidoreductase [Solirubrobacterales bacterium]|nr:NADH:flavin oxidoreductase [Solirubrobacterales bacterium]